MLLPEVALLNTYDNFHLKVCLLHPHRHTVHVLSLCKVIGCFVISYFC